MTVSIRSFWSNFSDWTGLTVVLQSKQLFFFSQWMSELWNLFLPHRSSPFSFLSDWSTHSKNSENKTTRIEFRNFQGIEWVSCGIIFTSSIFVFFVSDFSILVVFGIFFFAFLFGIFGTRTRQYYHLITEIITNYITSCRLIFNLWLSSMNQKTIYYLRKAGTTRA